MKAILSWAFNPAVVLAFLAGTRLEREYNQHPGAEELKLSIHNLEAWGDEMHPQLREYLNARSCTLLIGGIRGEWVDNAVDHGPIDRDVLGPIFVVKGPESDGDLYRLALESAGVERQ